MANAKIKRALIAVYDKTGIVDFARALVEEFGIEIISTGGTAAHLQNAGIPVTLVEDVTGCPEMLDGRVKTLHPKIHAAILADRDNPEHMRQLAEQGIAPIDVVVVNLYPFEETIAKPDCTFEDAIEMIDIGGPCLLRAAAKNHKHVLVVDRAYYYTLARDALRGEHPFDSNAELRRRLALSAFSTTRACDINIKDYFLSQLFEHSTGDGLEEFPDFVMLGFERHSLLRYGENPHQEAARYRVNESRETLECADGGASAIMPSFNNYVDASAALELCADLTRASEPRTEVRGSLAHRERTSICVFVKHSNACGVGVTGDAVEAYRRAYLGDPNAAMGGILACSFPVAPDFATAVVGTYDRWGRDTGAGGFFVEAWVAPSFDNDAVKVIRTRKNWGERVRLLVADDVTARFDEDAVDLKRIVGGVLMQTRDLVGLKEDQWEVVTQRQPTEREMADLRLAWLVCKHTKSNAISICRDGMLIGNGAGQTSRVMSCRIATWLAEENGHLGGEEATEVRATEAGARTSHEATQRRRDEGTSAQRTEPQAQAREETSRPDVRRDQGAVAASDGFFPFRDGPDLLMDAGVTAIIQPGGSKRDAETIAACNERGAAMIFTHTRHFKH